jgi:hypothetical protein
VIDLAMPRQMYHMRAMPEDELHEFSQCPAFSKMYVHAQSVRRLEHRILFLLNVDRREVDRASRQE